MKQKVPNTIIAIAIAGDPQMVRDIFVSNINSLKYCKVVFAAADGQELLNYLKAAEKKPDLCLLDINMPQLNGYDTQEYITKHWPEMKTLAMSIYDDPESVEQMVKNGSNGFISKNLPIKLLHEAIMAVYHHGIYPMQNKTPIHLKGLPLLTEREKEFLTLTCAELNMEETAKKMNISMRTADRYRENVYQKLKVTNKAELIFYVNRTAIVFMK